MSTLAEIEAAADALAPDQAERLLQHIAQRLCANQVPPGQRVAELHPDAIEMAADFDAPLPDEFWLGKES